MEKATGIPAVSITLAYEGKCLADLSNLAGTAALLCTLFHSGGLRFVEGWDRDGGWSSAMRGRALCRLQRQGLVVARAHRPVARRQGPRLAGPRRFVPLDPVSGDFHSDASALCRSDSGRAGKVRGQTPKVAKQDKKKHKTGRAKRRIQYNRRFVNVVAGAGKKKGPNCNNVA